MLERLMLGQAQECFYEKALGEGKPNQICARIAQQVALFYEEAHAALLLPPCRRTSTGSGWPTCSSRRATSTPRRSTAPRWTCTRRRRWRRRSRG
ncbi:hypothetical protein CLOM_g2568 [Closterium sp. NIES-68]|nr:hypothetical protein CLOM_g2568 [Closterium sp. NIES-68]